MSGTQRRETPTPGGKLVRILHIEDNPRDTELMGEILAEDGIECEIIRVESREGYVAALERGGFHLIVCDFSLPSFHGDEAQDLALAMRPDVPFLYLSGTIGEENAVEVLKKGATDYVLKGNLAKLPSAVRRALAEARERDDRRRAEEALRSSEQRYRRLFERNLAGVFRSTVDGRILECNLAFARIFGYDSPEELLAPSAADLYPQRSDREAFLERIRRERTLVGYEASFRQRDGSVVSILENVTLLSGEGREEILEGTIIDITERKKLEDQIRQSQKMEAVGRLAGGVAHDFNNILTAILGYSDLLGASLSATNPLREEVEGIRNAAERASALTRQLLAFSRKQVLVIETVDLNVLVRDMEKMLRRVIGEDVQIRTVYDPAVGKVRADRGQLEQVLVNLVINARDAMPAGGSIRIETSTAASPAADPSEVVLSVTDTGTGMDAETIAHIFEPFYTTKEKGKGTGLGLATVYGIVEQSGGRIDVSSEVGRGSTFRVCLPTAEDA